jgi:hypothetical protein
MTHAAHQTGRLRRCGSFRLNLLSTALLIEELVYVFRFSSERAETYVAFKKRLIGLAKPDEGKSLEDGTHNSIFL